MRVSPERLREVRELKAMSVLELAQKFHCQPSYIYQFESGKRKPGPAYLALYVKHTSLTADEALGLSA